MVTYAVQAFSDQKVHIDGATFIDCEFRRATLVFAGGALPYFSGCHFESCTWTLEAHAERTIALLKFLIEENEGLRDSILRELGIKPAF